MKTVVIIGGGITGLSTAYYLSKRVREGDHALRIVLVEASEALGGKIRSVQTDEFIMETGADSIVARKPNVAPFLEELGLQDEVVYNATGISYIYTEGALKQIPKDAVFGIPLSLESLATSTLVSAEGKVAALKDFYTPNETFTKEDSIGAFLEYFLGRELVEKQISPVLSGVYSGRLEELTIASTLPYLLDYKNQYGSIIQGLAENRQRFQGTGDRKFLSFNKGMNALIDRMEERLTGTEVNKGVRAEAIRKHDERYSVTLSNGEAVEADFVVLGTLHTVAQQLLQDEELDADFNDFKNSSLISVYLGFDLPDSELPQDGTGFIAAEGSGLKCNACTWTSRKWAHTSENKQLLVRLFYKNSIPDYEAMLKLSVEELTRIALQDIERSLGIQGKPVSVDVTPWHETMPNYHLKHPHLVKSLERKLAAGYPRVLLAGCSYYGVGIADCILNGDHTAARIIEQL